MSAPGHKMVLKEIYEWFEKNTNKSKNSDSKGWQNSIRHNLSMNAVSLPIDRIPEVIVAERYHRHSKGLKKSQLRVDHRRKLEMPGF
jgi:hypothetical protein